MDEVTLDRQLIVIGGTEDETACDTVEEFDTRASRWTNSTLINENPSHSSLVKFQAHLKFGKKHKNIIQFLKRRNFENPSEELENKHAAAKKIPRSLGSICAFVHTSKQHHFKIDFLSIPRDRKTQRKNWHRSSKLFFYCSMTHK